jgi:hypothetical protein
VARGSNGSWGWGLGSSRAAAESDALAMCAAGGSLRQPGCVANGTSAVNVPITNTTSFSAHITFSGPVTRSVTIGPGAIQALTQSPGTYTATGQVLNAGNVTFVPSTWNVTPGCDYPLQIVMR